MAVTVKTAVLWRKDLENRPGALAETLKPLSDSGVSLQVLMGYAFPGEPDHAAVEVFPIAGTKAEQAASEAGLAPSPDIACLLVQGDDKPGLGHAIADKLAANGINISFVMVQVTGDKYLGIFGFESQEEADRAIAIIKEADRSISAQRRSIVRKSIGTPTTKRTAAKEIAAKKSVVRKAGAKTAAKKGGAKSVGKKGGAKSPARKTGAKLAGKKTGTQSVAKKTGARTAATQGGTKSATRQITAKKSTVKKSGAKNAAANRSAA